MSKETRIGPATRLVPAADVRVRVRKGGSPVDFARDHLVILDADCRPVAECWPIEREADAPPAAPALSEQRTRAAPAAQNRSPGQNRGPLTDAHRELLQRLWQEHPRSLPDAIGELFEAGTGRPVSVITVNSYRPGKPA